MYNHSKAQQSKNRVHISWDILYGMESLIHEVVITYTCPKYAVTARFHGIVNFSCVINAHGIIKT